MIWSFFGIFVLLAIKTVTANSEAISLAKKYLPSGVVYTSVGNQAGKQPTMCVNVWSKDGWVCKQKELIAYSENDYTKLKLAETDFIQLLTRLKDLEKLFIQKIPEFNKTRVFHHYFTRLQDSMVQEQIEEAKKCWSHMGKLRNSSLCFTCSAKNYQYYSSNKGLITMDDCRGLVAQCEKHFVLMAKLRYIFDYFPSLANDTLKDEAFANKCKKAFNDSTPAYHLLSWYIGATDLIDSDLQKAKTCEWSLKLKDVPVLHSILKVFDEPTKLMTDYMIRYKNSSYITAPSVLFGGSMGFGGRRRVLWAGNWGSRSLSNEEQLAKDVLVTEFDNKNLILMNPSSDPSMVPNLSSSLPMNLSLAFP